VVARAVVVCRRHAERRVRLRERAPALGRCAAVRLWSDGRLGAAPLVVRCPAGKREDLTNR
jgi:hypothetical protein